MRLADELELFKGHPEHDLGGPVTNLCRRLSLAQLFEISEEVQAAAHVIGTTRPTKAISAISYARSPYPVIWVEWSCANRLSLPGTLDTTSELKPLPKRQGALIEEKAAAVYQVTWAWSHKDSVYVCPLAAVVSPDIGALTAYCESRPYYTKRRQVTKELIKSQLNSSMGPRSSWKKFENNEAELDAMVELNRHIFFTISDFCIDALVRLVDIYGRENIPVLLNNWGIIYLTPRAKIPIFSA